VRVWSTSFPKLQGVSGTDAVDLYLSSYLQTYIERDVRELLGIQKRREFEIFVRMCALRTGQVLNTVEIARDSGISPNTAKEWISLLEDSFLIRLVHPHHSNRTLRMIKSPKLYFLDAGLAAWLAGWRDPETLRLSPMAGAIYETQVFGELLRHDRHRAREVDITYWRTRDGEEIDFLVESAGRICPIDLKMGTPDARVAQTGADVRLALGRRAGGFVAAPGPRLPARDDRRRLAGRLRLGSVVSPRIGPRRGGGWGALRLSGCPRRCRCPAGDTGDNTPSRW